MIRSRRRLLALSLWVAIGCDRPAGEPYRLCLDAGPWIAALGSEDPFRSDEALQALVALGDAAVPALAAALEREDAATRAGVLEALHDIGSQSALGPLLEATDDQDLEVRTSALASLADFDDPRTVPVVEAALADPGPRVRQAAAIACRVCCRSEAAFDRLVALALDPEIFTVAETARSALATTTRPTARAAMERAVPAALVAATTPPGRLRAALLLADMGDARAVGPLVTAVETSVGTPLERFHAIMALGKIVDPSAVAALTRIAGGADPVQTNAACSALRALAERGAGGAADAIASCPARPSGSPRDPGDERSGSSR